MTTYVFTSISANYVPKARVLAESVQRHGEDVRFCLLLAEEGSGGESPWPEFDEILRLDDLAIPGLRSWVFGHELVELCTAVKGACLVHLLERSDCDEVLYFDPDIVVLSPLDAITERFQEGSVLLTPHLTEPERSLEAILDNEISALRHGIYNLGFLAVRNDGPGKRFAAWWWDRLRHFCVDDIPGGLFTDQRWVDLAPAFFEEVVVVRDAGWNVATWNLGHRTVRGSLREGLTSNGEPVRFYHFSGLDSGAQLAMLDKYGPDMPALYELREWYLERCEELDDEDGNDGRWVLGSYSNGEPIRPVQRRLYRHREDLRQAFPDPYDTSDVNRSYFDWYRVNQGEGVGGAQGGSDPLREELDLCRRELRAIRSSRSWRIARFLQRWLGPVYRLLRRRRAW